MTTQGLRGVFLLLFSLSLLTGTVAQADDWPRSNSQSANDVALAIGTMGAGALDGMARNPTEEVAIRETVDMAIELIMVPKTGKQVRVGEAFGLMAAALMDSVARNPEAQPALIALYNHLASKILTLKLPPKASYLTEVMGKMGAAATAGTARNPGATALIHQAMTAVVNSLEAP